MTVYFTQYRQEIVKEVLEKTSIEKCRYNDPGFRDFLFVNTKDILGVPSFYSGETLLIDDIGLTWDQFVKKCIELYPPKKGEE